MPVEEEMGDPLQVCIAAMTQSFRSLELAKKDHNDAIDEAYENYGKAISSELEMGDAVVLQKPMTQIAKAAALDKVGKLTTDTQEVCRGILQILGQEISGK